MNLQEILAATFTRLKKTCWPFNESAVSVQKSSMQRTLRVKS